MIILRPLRDDEQDLVLEASMGTLNWPGSRFTEEEAWADSTIARYLRTIRERGDFGIVAEAAGERIGLAWMLFLPADEPGYGFVDEGVPEFALWVREGYRRQGLGRRLTRATLGEARQRGLTAVSLSVEAENPSRGLYLTEGFVPVPGGEEDGVMVKAL
ncbi:MAG: GNAT family N-acetyltransferase [bacterium]|nr:GNAT family N-acetyltransferase [bacterium]